MTSGVAPDRAIKLGSAIHTGERCQVRSRLYRNTCTMKYTHSFLPQPHRLHVSVPLIISWREMCLPPLRPYSRHSCNRFHSLAKLEQSFLPASLASVPSQPVYFQSFAPRTAPGWALQSRGDESERNRMEYLMNLLPLQSGARVRESYAHTRFVPGRSEEPVRFTGAAIEGIQVVARFGMRRGGA